MIIPAGHAVRARLNTAQLGRASDMLLRTLATERSLACGLICHTIIKEEREESREKNENEKRVRDVE
jgi:hypothetical protein